MSNPFRDSRRFMLAFAIVLVTTATIPLNPAHGGYYDETVIGGSPRAYWRLGEAPGAASAVDSSANGVHGTYQGGVTLGVQGSPPTRPNTAAQFDGVNDVVTFGDVFRFVGMAPFSLEAWIYLPPGSQGGPVFAKRDHGVGGIDSILGGRAACGRDPRYGGYYLQVTRSTLALARTTSDMCTGVISQQSLSASMPPGDRWHHVVGTYDGQVIRLYLNGTLAAEGGGPNIFMRSVAVPLLLGQDGSGKYSGIIDEAAVFDRALSASEVERHYGGDRPDLAKVTFVSPVTVANAMQWAQTKGTDPVEVEAEYPNSDATETVTIGYLVDPLATRAYARAGDGAAAEGSSYGTEASELLDELSTSMANDPDMTQTQRTHVLSIRQTFAAGPTQINKMTLTGSTATLQGLRSDPAVASVEIQSEIPPPETTPTPPPPPSEEEICGQPWWPARGRAVTGRHSATRRAIYQTFRWNAARLDRLKCYDDVTYEADAWFQTANGLYLGADRVWGTNMPSGYKDTRLFDSSSRRTYTVGTSDAKRLRAEHQYWTLYLTTWGEASTDSGAIQGQRGDRSPTFCHIPICIFSEATADLIPSGSYQVPSNRTWTGGTLVG